MKSRGEKVANMARNALSRYCVEECSAYCCRKGYIILTLDEMNLIVQNQLEVLKNEESLKELIDGKYSLNFSNSFNGCPRLKDSKCSIHKNSKRPKTCKEFPIFISQKKVRVSPRCYGVKAGLISPYITQLKKMGYSIEEI